VRAERAEHPLAAALRTHLDDVGSDPQAPWRAAAERLDRPVSPAAAAAWAEVAGQAIAVWNRWPAPAGSWTDAELAAVRSPADGRALLAGRGLPAASPQPSLARGVRTPSTVDGWLGQLFYRKGKRLAVRDEAAAWEAIAADLGDPDALAERARGLEARGATALAEAYVCWNLAAAHGHPDGAVGRDRTGAQLTPADRQVAEERALARWSARLPSV